MRLITKTIFYYLIVIIPLLALAGLFGYSMVKKEVQDSMDEYLWKEKLNAEKIIRSQNISDVVYLSTDSLSHIIPVSIDETGHAYGDTKIYDEFEEEVLDFRILKSYYEFKNQNFLIVVAKSTLEDDDLMESLLKTFGLIVGLLVLAFFVLSLILSKTLWKPFYKSVSLLNAYDVKKHNQLKFDKSSVKEFKQLNETLNKMTEKIYLDYAQQKEFTENASHEMQTPLAVIKANLNLLMQSSNLREEEMKQIETIDNTVRKLSSLNKALLLLSKIENDQFFEKTKIHLNDVICKAVMNYQELAEVKSIEVKVDLKEDAFVSMNPALADILIGNLIQNAIRHNEENGNIGIELNKNHLIISNSGAPLRIDPNDLFIRFKKNDASKDSLGLGLSIVQSITNLYGFKIDYQYKENSHHFCLKF